MAKKQKVVLLIHGMGNHTAPGTTSRGSFGKEFIDTCNLALERYPKHAGQGIESHVDIVEFNYNAWFDKVRTKMADKAKSVNERLTAIGAAYQVSFPLSFVGELSSLEQKYGDDKFFYTHWLDVIFYSTILGAKVRVDAGAAIAKLVRDYGAGNVHVVAHSLGTAVAHDTLALLYRPESDPEDKIPDLHPVNHKLASVWMIANVSRLLHSVNRVADPLHSVVRPGDAGCTALMNNVRHRLDPFTWISRFSPQNDGRWLLEPVYDAYYTPIVNDLVTSGNTHAITQYLDDPNVAEVLFAQLLKFKASSADLAAARAEYRAKSLQGAYAVLQQELSSLQIGEFQSWSDFLSAGEKLQNAIDLIRKEFK